VPRHPPQALAVGAEHKLIDEREGEAQRRQRGRRTDRDNRAAGPGAGLLEVVWAIALKHTNGFTPLWPSVIGVSAAVISFVMLSSA
jgi:Small Multidrug Resistance protein